MRNKAKKYRLSSRLLLSKSISILSSMYIASGGITPICTQGVFALTTARSSAPTAAPRSSGESPENSVQSSRQENPASLSTARSTGTRNVEIAPNRQLNGNSPHIIIGVSDIVSVVVDDKPITVQLQCVSLVGKDTDLAVVTASDEKRSQEPSGSKDDLDASASESVGNASRETLKANALAKKTERDEAANKWEAAANISDAAAKAYEKAGNTSSAAAAYNNAANYYSASGKYGASATCFSQAARLFKQTGNTASANMANLFAGANWSTVAGSDSQAGNAAGAARAYMLSAESYRDCGDDPSQAATAFQSAGTTLQTIASAEPANSAAAAAGYEKAAQSFAEANRQGIAAGNQPNDNNLASAATAYGLAASAAKATGNSTEANRLSKLSIKLSDAGIKASTGNAALQGSCYSAAAAGYSNLGKAKESAQAYEKAATAYQSAGNPAAAAQAFTLAAGEYKAIANLNDAIKADDSAAKAYAAAGNSSAVAVSIRAAATTKKLRVAGIDAQKAQSDQAAGNLVAAANAFQSAAAAYKSAGNLKAAMNASYASSSAYNTVQQWNAAINETNAGNVDKDVYKASTMRQRAKTASEGGNMLAAANARDAEARYYTKAGNTSAAAAAFNAAAAAYNSVDKFIAAATCYNLAGKALHALGDTQSASASAAFKSAAQAFDSAASSFNSSGNYAAAAAAYKQAGVAYQTCGERTSAIKTYSAAEAADKLASNSSGATSMASKASALKAKQDLSRAQTLSSVGNQAEAAKAYDEAGANYLAANDPSAAANAYNNAGIAYANINDYKTAATTYETAAKNYTASSNSASAAQAYQSAAGEYNSAKDYMNAGAAYMNAANEFEGSNSNWGAVGAYQAAAQADIQARNYSGAGLAYNAQANLLANLNGNEPASIQAFKNSAKAYEVAARLASKENYITEVASDDAGAAEDLAKLNQNALAIKDYKTAITDDKLAGNTIAAAQARTQESAAKSALIATETQGEITVADNDNSQAQIAEYQGRMSQNTAPQMYDAYTSYCQYTVAAGDAYERIGNIYMRNGDFAAAQQAYGWSANSFNDANQTYSTALTVVATGFQLYGYSSSQIQSVTSSAQQEQLAAQTAFNQVTGLAQSAATKESAVASKHAPSLDTKNTAYFVSSNHNASISEAMLAKAPNGVMAQSARNDDLIERPAAPVSFVSTLKEVPTSSDTSAGILSATKNVVLGQGSIFVAHDGPVLVHTGLCDLKVPPQGVAYVMQVGSQVAIYNFYEAKGGNIQVVFPDKTLTLGFADQLVLSKAPSSNLTKADVARIASASAPINQGTFAGVTVTKAQFTPQSVLSGMPQFQRLLTSRRQGDKKLVARMIKLAAIESTLEGN
jgi:tetratricopeptide (TPR) repeat protein